MYLYDSGERTYKEAKAFCKLKGATLLMIRDEEKQKMIENLFRNSSIWLALEKKKRERPEITKFDWETPILYEGATLMHHDYQNWAPDQHNKTEKCVIMRNTNTTGVEMEWIQFPCDSNASVVCEKKNTGDKMALLSTSLAHQKISVKQNDG